MKPRYIRLFQKMVRKAITGSQLINRNLFQNLLYRYPDWIGVNMLGKPKYIDKSCFFDEVDYGLITISENVVISKDVSILVHDYSISRAIKAIEHTESISEYYICKPSIIGVNSFIGLGTIILPGAIIKENTIIGAGSVVPGKELKSVLFMQAIH